MNLRYILLIGGILVFVVNSISFARRRVTPMIALLWTMFAGVMLLFAILPFWGVWIAKVNPVLPFPLVVMSGLMLFGLYASSVGVSRLVDRNRELAMHIALLNEENERIKDVLRKLGGDI